MSSNGLRRSTGTWLDFSRLISSVLGVIQRWAALILPLKMTGSGGS
jgi:hypothetical protein